MVSEIGVDAMVELGEQAVPHIPFWKHVEPRCRNDNFASGLEAKSADPFWLLARQWQVGEFQAEDTGSPVKVEFTTKTQHITGVVLGNQTSGVPLDENSPPLETLVEREYIELDWRTRVRIGQQLERLLLHAEAEIDVNRVICHLRQKYPINRPGPDDHIHLDRATQRFLSVMAGRAIDGAAFINAIRYTSGSDIRLPGDWTDWLGDDEDGVKDAIGELRKWFESLYGSLDAREPSQSPAWVPEDLEYTFNVHTTGDDDKRTTLVAPHYRNGELDWYAFRVLNDTGDKDSEEKEHKFVPTRVSFPGMPHARWWAFEDNQVDFGNVVAATTDLAKLMIMNFAMLYGDDWFIIPLPAKINTLTRIKDEQLRVTDVFGQVTNINPARSVSENLWETWQMFGISFQDNPNEVGSLLYLPPTVSFREESPPLEEVRFIRDEMANMVWGIEHTVPNGLGEPVQGFEAQSERHAREREADLRKRLAELRQLKEQLLQQLGGQTTVYDEETEQTRESLQTKVDELEEQIKQLQSSIASAGLAPQPQTIIEVEIGLPHYRLSSTVLDNWIPFVPVRVSPSSFEVYLRQAQMVRNEVDQSLTGIKPMTRLLAGLNGSGGLDQLHEEAIPRAGQRVQMTRQRVRWVDGKTHVWVGRKITTGRGEGSSGLMFDFMKGDKR